MVMLLTPRFLSDTIRVETRDLEVFTLLEPLVFQRANGELITARAGTVTDGASVPNWVRRLLPESLASKGRRHMKSGVSHDAMYHDTATPAVPDQATADLIFLEMLLAEGCPQWEADAFYYAVRAGGERYWFAGHGV